jgi:acetate kinase
MLLIQYTFHVQIIDMEKRLSRVKGELNAMKEEATTTKKEETRKKEEGAKKEAKRTKQTTKDMVAKWWKNGGQSGYSKDCHIQF